MTDFPSLQLSAAPHDPEWAEALHVRDRAAVLARERVGRIMGLYDMRLDTPADVNPVRVKVDGVELVDGQFVQFCRLMGADPRDVFSELARRRGPQ